MPLVPFDVRLVGDQLVPGRLALCAQQRAPQVRRLKRLRALVLRRQGSARLFDGQEDHQADQRRR